MGEANNDFYKMLQSERSATTEELKRNYQRLILTLHPDKSSQGDESEMFCLVQKAWSILKDSEKRKLYDAELSCQEHNNLLLYETISLRDMDLDKVNHVYTYDCRCGGTYVLELCENFPENIVIGCDECSFSIQVNH